MTSPFQFSTRITAATTAATVIALALATGSAAAHEGEIKAQHGGQIHMAGPYHIELVMNKDSKEAKENPLLVYVTDHDGNKVVTKGSSGSATVLAGKTKTTVKLVEDGDNRLKGSATYAANANIKVVVSISMAGQAAEQARFTPFAPAKDGHTDHKH